MSLSLVSYGDSDSDIEPEDTNSAKPGSDVRKLLSVLPSSRGSLKQKGPVKIGLPTLNKGGDDSDSDDDAPQIKKKKQSGIGLTALLPAPKGGSNERGFGRKGSSNTKTMVPYTLSKRYQDSKKKSSLKNTKPSTKSGGDGSDSDGEAPASFFSLDDSPSVPKPSISLSIPLPDDCISEPESKSETQEQSNTAQFSSVGPALPEQYSYSNYYSTSHCHGTNEQYSCLQDQSVQGYSSQYPAVTQAQSQANKGEISNVSDMSAVGPGLSIDEDQLRRLAGVKRGRRREDGLNNITEIREDDVKESIKTFQKYHTEDSVNKFFQNEASKMDAPTGQQKRKHQLSFLAHQAKENELELSKHWAQAAASRRQSQMKYGF